MLSRKHYKAIASIIKNNSVDLRHALNGGKVKEVYISKNHLVNELCGIFANDNSLFSRSKFVEACNDD